MGTPVPPDAPAPAILVVDNAKIDQHYVAGLLHAHGGWRVTFAGNGVEALAAISREPPAVVLTDMQMPVMNGLTLVEKVREQFPHVPVVIMTGAGTEQAAVEALRAGAADYVPKP